MNEMIAKIEMHSELCVPPPNIVLSKLAGVKYVEEKIGIDGELHKTDCYGEFWPVADTSDIYGDGSMVCLRRAA